MLNFRVAVNSAMGNSLTVVTHKIEMFLEKVMSWNPIMKLCVSVTRQTCGRDNRGGWTIAWWQAC